LKQTLEAYRLEMSRIPHRLDNRLKDGGEVVSLKRLPRFTPFPCIFMVLISVRGLVNPRALVRLEGLDKLKKKNPIISRFEPATIKLVAYRLNQLCYRVHLRMSVTGVFVSSDKSWGFEPLRELQEAIKLKLKRSLPDFERCKRWGRQKTYTKGYWKNGEHFAQATRRVNVYLLICR
jgi:hypothetical protein